MKTTIFCILLIFTYPLEMSSNTYYFSSLTGNDNYSSSQAQNISTPWKSIEKLNSSMNIFKPGDNILFKRGETFIGEIILGISGKANAHVSFGAYGSGEAPVIKGFIPVTNWFEYYQGIWVADCPLLEGDVTNFLINGKVQQIGRYPNKNESNSGYLKIDTHEGHSQLSSSSLSEPPDWSGGEALVRTERWILDKAEILSHNDNTLIFKDPTSYEIKDNYGFFIQKHLNTLDQDGEWYFDKATKKMYLYHSTDPNLLVTEATAFTNNFIAFDKQYFSIENIEFCGSSGANILISFSNDFEIKNAKVSLAGNDGVYIIGCHNFNLTSSEIFQINNNAILISGCKDGYLTNNYIHAAGLIAGMGSKSVLTYLGLYLEGSNIYCELNTIDSVGYNGILFGGDSIYIKNNYIDHFCMTVDDGGGIYTSGHNNEINYNRIVEGNIIINGLGAGDGTSRPDLTSAEGIYLDNRTNNVSVLGNTVANCSNIGIFVHNANHISISGNTVYNNLRQIAFVHDENMPDFPITECLVENNIFYSKFETQLLAYYLTLENSEIYLYGNFKSNFYCRPVDDDLTIQILNTGNSIYTNVHMDLKTWQNTYFHDINSSVTPYIIPSYSILNLIGTDKSVNGKFEYGISGWSFWSTYSNHNANWESNNILDNGSLKLNFNEYSGNPESQLIASGDINEVVAGESYILRFSMVSSDSERRVKVGLRNGSSPFNNIASEKSFLVGNTRKEFEILFIPDSNEPLARIDFTFPEVTETFWIDNVEFYRADIQATNIDDSVFFVYNPGNSVKSVYDNNYYIDVRGNKYHNFTIQPYQSLILKKTSGDNYNKIDLTEQGIIMNIYPNPAKDNINILTNETGNHTFTIINIFGRIVYEGNFPTEDASIDISSLTKGIYVLRMTINKTVVASKFLIN